MQIVCGLVEIHPLSVDVAESKVVILFRELAEPLPILKIHGYTPFAMHTGPGAVALTHSSIDQETVPPHKVMIHDSLSFYASLA